MPFINDFDPYAGDFTKPNKGLPSVKPSELGRSNTVNTNALSDFQFSSKKPIKGVQRSNTIGAHAGPHAGASLSDITQICSWNRALLPRDFTNSLVHDAIKEHARSTPSAEAICSWDGSYNFQELNELSTQVGAFLVSKGVGPETFVPLLFEKSAWFVIAAVGVMKAGGAYVPLDINHPKERLEQIVQEVDAKIMLASSAGAKLGVEVDEIIELSPSSYSWLPEADEVISSVQPHNAVYVIFTSGSTGKPKGVVIEHRQFYSSAVARQKLTRSDSTCRVLQFASYSFDISVIDILPTLMFGGTVCIISEYDRPADAIGAIHRLRANEIHITPSVINTMGPHLLPKMKTIGCGGECMLQTTIDMWAEETYLINGYGPTEACVITTAKVVTKETEPTNIGTGEGAATWIVDPDDHNILMPIGEVGEMIVEGPILARGYLNDDAKTAAAFITDPTWTRRCNPVYQFPRTRRFYKTGDLVKYDSEGNLTILGRKDQQIKLRGHRIELGDIENNLRTLFQERDVSDLAVELCKFSSNHNTGSNGNTNDKIITTLVAFICLGDAGFASEANGSWAGDDSHEGSEDTRRILVKTMAGVPEKLETLLPEYMVPRTIVPIRSLPLTIAGKVDRKALKKLAEDYGTAGIMKCGVFGG